MEKRQTKTSVVGFQARPDEVEKLRRLSAKTGLSVSDVFRALIDSAAASPVISWRPVVRVEVGQMVTSQ